MLGGSIPLRASRTVFAIANSTRRAYCFGVTRHVLFEHALQFVTALVTFPFCGN